MFVPLNVVIVPRPEVSLVLIKSVTVLVPTTSLVTLRLVTVPMPAFIFPLNPVAVITPVTNASPTTCKADVGFVVPKPTAPET